MSELNDDQKRLADALEELKEHNFMRIHESAWKFLYYNLLRGLAIGLGSVVGATLLVTILIQILAQIEFIPILGLSLIHISDPRDRNVSRMPSSA